MALPSSNSGPFKQRQKKTYGSYDRRKHQSAYQTKSDDIKKSLVHRARLRKAYYKMLEREGEEIPSKDRSYGSDNEEQKNKSDEEGNSDNNSNDENDNADASESEEEQGGFFEGEPVESKESNTSTKNSYRERKSVEKKERAMSFYERSKLIKERKLAKRKAQEEYRANREKEHQLREAKRVKHRNQMKKFTNRGQPLMKSRINRLLDKIKETN
ncbi:hypothetical protein DV495_003233 [Geotrichum candidum]|nr:hypothetical protein DV452_000060 [Geotrichum candidum]KAF5126768.1 hypothetical protein DV495_003233 [Geotrichum candidum]KAI8135450.1 hypothetical protein DUD61_000946 [Geotrichum candidum]